MNVCVCLEKLQLHMMSGIWYGVMWCAVEIAHNDMIVELLVVLNDIAKATTKRLKL